MTEKQLKCSTCGIVSRAVVEFPCPGCAKATIVRCRHCRAINNSYTCPKCKFTGP